MSVAPTPATTAPVETAEASQEQWKALTAICVPLIMVSIDGTILNVALPTIAQALNATSAQLVWINSAYIIMFGSTILLSGSLGDKVGRKLMLMLGMTVFIMGSIWAGLSGSPGELIAARALQGLGGGMLMPATLSLITNIFAVPAERAKAIATWAGMSGVGVAAGPILGGLLLTIFDWGSVFFINVPVCVLGLYMIRRYVPESENPSAPPIDWLGAILSLTGLFAIFFFLIEGPEQGWSHPPVLGSLVLGVVLLLGFGVRELRTRYPLLDIKLFGQAPFASGVLSIAIAMFALFGLLYELTLYLQAARGLTPFQAGFALVPFALVLLLGAPQAPKLAASIGIRLTVVIGLLLVGGGMAVFYFLSVDSRYVLVMLGLVLVGLGVALIQPPASNAIMGSVPPEKAGMGASTNAAIRQIASSLGIVVVGGVGQTVYVNQLTASGALAGLPANAAAMAQASITGAAEVAQQLGPQGATLQAAASTAFVSGMHAGAIVAAVVALIGALIAWRAIPNRKLDPSEQVAPDAG